MLAWHRLPSPRGQYLKQVLLGVRRIDFGGIDLAERGDEVLDALVVLLIGYTVRRRKLEKEGGNLRHVVGLCRGDVMYVGDAGFADGVKCGTARGGGGGLQTVGGGWILLGGHYAAPETVLVLSYNGNWCCG
jgi:hypothetical protein